MFSQVVEYALRTVVHLVSVAPAARTTEQIAAATRVPPAYLAKVVRRLVEGGVLHAQRGPGGGISLAHRPEELTVLTVVNAVDPIRRIYACPLDLAAQTDSLCSLQQWLDDVLALVENAFATTTVAEIVAGPALSPVADGRVQKGSGERRGVSPPGEGCPPAG